MAKPITSPAELNTTSSLNASHVVFLPTVEAGTNVYSGDYWPATTLYDRGAEIFIMELNIRVGPDDVVERGDHWWYDGRLFEDQLTVYAFENIQGHEFEQVLGHIQNLLIPNQAWEAIGAHPLNVKVSRGGRPISESIFLTISLSASSRTDHHIDIPGVMQADGGWYRDRHMDPDQAKSCFTHLIADLESKLQNGEAHLEDFEFDDSTNNIVFRGEDYAEALPPIAIQDLITLMSNIRDYYANTLGTFYGFSYNIHAPNADGPNESIANIHMGPSFTPPIFGDESSGLNASGASTIQFTDVVNGTSSNLNSTGLQPTLNQSNLAPPDRSLENPGSSANSVTAA